MTLQALKLASGEELVVDVVEENDEMLTFKNPTGIVLRNTNSGPAIGFLPWMKASNGPFVMKKTMIVCTAEVAEEVKNGYNQIFGAGIVVPPKQLLVS